MPTILTVDDSRAVRTIVSKQVKDLGFDVLEAEDGEQGLAKLQEVDVALILLDVTMPVLDGPGMLTRLRAQGNKTPVIMLTSESKRSVVAGAMRMGIDDYILKPFKPEELRAKILAALQSEGAASPAQAAAPGTSAPGAEQPKAPLPSAAPARQFIDVLVVDDMENVQKRLRTLLPERLTLQGALTAAAAVTLCRERTYRVILIDAEMPDVSSATLASQLRLLQPHAAVLALALRTTADAAKHLIKTGFDEVLYKPFSPENLEDFTMQHFDTQELVVCEENLIRLKPVIGKADRMERYAQRLGQLVPPMLAKLASACFETLIVDINHIPIATDRLPKMLVTLSLQAKAVGLGVALVGPPGMERLLGDYDETKDIPCFASVEEARAAQA